MKCSTLSWTLMRLIFWHRHVRDTMVILDYGNSLHPWCLLYDMLVLWKAQNGMHSQMAQCTQGEERKRHRLVAEEEREVTTSYFSAYRHPLEIVTSLEYLGRVI